MTEKQIKRQMKEFKQEQIKQQYTKYSLMLADTNEDYVFLILFSISKG